MAGTRPRRLPPLSLEVGTSGHSAEAEDDGGGCDLTRGFDLTIVIVTWNCRDMVGRALDHLFKSRTGLRYKVVLVDNESSDGTPDAVAAAFPAVEIVRSGGNL